MRMESTTLEHAENSLTPNMELVKRFIGIARDLGIQPDAYREMLVSPHSYFDEAFDGILSDKGLYTFLRVATMKLDIDPKEVKALGMELRNYNENKKRVRENYSKQEVEILQIGIKFIEKYVEDLKCLSKEEILASNDGLASAAYLTNRLIKAKMHIAHSQSEMENLRSVNQETIDGLLRDAVKTSSLFSEEVSSVSEEEVVTGFSRTEIQNVMSLSKSIRKVIGGLEGLPAETRESLFLALADLKSWPDDLADSNLFESFSGNGGADFLRLLDEMVVGKDINLELFIRYVVEGLQASSNKEKVGTRMHEFISSLSRLSKEPKINPMKIGVAGISVGEVEGIIANEINYLASSEIADLYMVKEYLMALFSINKTLSFSDNSFEEILKSIMDSEERPGGGIRKDQGQGTYAINLTNRYNGNLSLHFKKDGFITMMLAAYQRYQ